MLMTNEERRRCGIVAVEEKHDILSIIYGRKHALIKQRGKGDSKNLTS